MFLYMKPLLMVCEWPLRRSIHADIAFGELADGDEEQRNPKSGREYRYRRSTRRGAIARTRRLKHEATMLETE
jgi:hypothetical protein